MTVWGETLIKVHLAQDPPEPTGTCDVQKAGLQPLNHLLAQGDLVCFPENRQCSELKVRDPLTLLHPLNS